MNKRQREAAKALGDAQRLVDRAEEAAKRTRAVRNKAIARADKQMDRANIGAITDLSVARVGQIIREQREKKR